MKKEKKTIYLVLQMSQGSGAIYIYISMVSNSGWWHGKDIGVISTVDYTYLLA